MLHPHPTKRALLATQTFVWKDKPGCCRATACTMARPARSAWQEYHVVNETDVMVFFNRGMYIPVVFGCTASVQGRGLRSKQHEQYGVCKITIRMISGRCDLTSQIMSAIIHVRSHDERGISSTDRSEVDPCVRVGLLSALELLPRWRRSPVM